MPDPNYIDEIRFSDETFKIRDSEARALIEQLIITGGLPVGQNVNDMLFWDGSFWTPKQIYEVKDAVKSLSKELYIDTGISPGNDDLKIEMDFKLDTISDNNGYCMFLIGSDASNAVNGIAFGVHNQKWNTLIAGQDYGDSAISYDTNNNSITYQVINNTITITGDITITKTVNNLRTYNWQNSSVKIGFLNITPKCEYTKFKIYVNNVLMFDMEPVKSEILGQIGIRDKISGNVYTLNPRLYSIYNII